MPTLPITVVTLAGAEYVLFEGDAGPTFPTDEIRAGEAPADAARRVVGEWTGTKDPKLELMDFRVEGDALRFVFRAHLTADLATDRAHARHGRGGLPELAGPLEAREIEEMQKTSLSYKLTRA